MHYFSWPTTHGHVSSAHVSANDKNNKNDICNKKGPITAIHKYSTPKIPGVLIRPENKLDRVIKFLQNYENQEIISYSKATH